MITFKEQLPSTRWQHWIWVWRPEFSWNRKRLKWFGSRPSTRISHKTAHRSRCRSYFCGIYYTYIILRWPFVHIGLSLPTLGYDEFLGTFHWHLYRIYMREWILIENCMKKFVFFCYSPRRQRQYSMFCRHPNRQFGIWK